MEKVQLALPISTERESHDKHPRRLQSGKIGSWRETISIWRRFVAPRK